MAFSSILSRVASRPIMASPPRPLTHKDIARLVGVSQSTVSRALDPASSHLISDKVVEDIQRVSKEMGFQGNILARRLRNRRAETITLVVPSEAFKPPSNLDFEVGNHLLTWKEVQGVMSEALRRSYEVKLVPQFDDEPALAEQLLAHIGYPHSDGVIFGGLGTLTATAATLKQRGVPAVVMGAFPMAAPWPLVAFDQVPGIAAGLRHLIAQGRRRIAYLGFAPDFTSEVGWLPRFAAWRDTLREAGLYQPELAIHLPDERSLRAYLASHGHALPFDAAFCSNDIFAARLVRELIAIGRSVPGDIAVLGFDNNPQFRSGPQALSSVDLPLEERGRRALNLLVDWIEHGTEPPLLDLMPSTFVARATT